MDRSVSIPPSPGNLYTSQTIASALGFSPTAPASAIRTQVLRPFGRVRYPRGGAGVWLCTATQVSQWLARSRGRRWLVDYAAMDCWLNTVVELLDAAGRLSSSQRHVQNVSFNQLVWLSNKAWHGGRTAREEDAE